MKRMILILISLLFLLGCSYDPTKSDTAKKLEFCAFSIGKADSILIRTEDASILIDTGENGDGSKILDKLAAFGVEKLDLLILTHFDKDHIGGADTIIREMQIGRIILPSYEKESPQYSELSDALSETGASVTHLTQDESLTYGEMVVTVWNSPVSYDGKSDNDQSLITKIQYDGKTYLLMGDAEEAELKALIFSGKNLTCDVLKLPHHGVYDAQLFALLTVTMPSYVVICDSAKNPADAETLQTLTFFDANVLQTKDGDVRLISAESIIKPVE